MSNNREEIFIGLVGATGTDLHSVESSIREVLGQFDYHVETIKISDLFDDNDLKQKYKFRGIKKSNAFHEIKSQMEAGTIMRTQELESILTTYAIKEVKNLRKKKQQPRTAYLFRSLKHPKESICLKEVYSVGYYQIGIYSHEIERVSRLQKKNIKRKQAYELIDQRYVTFRV